MRSTPVPALLLSCLAACGPEREREIGNGAILTLGDSVLDSHYEEFRSVSDVIAEVTGMDVDHGAIGGATMGGAGEDSIPGQYVANHWKWVVINGGANDVGDGCGCGDCVGIIDDLVSPDLASGVVPDLLDRVANDGPNTVLLGYYEVVPGTEFDGCEEELDLLEVRYEGLAQARADTWFLDMGDAITPDKPSLYAEDRIHPSAAGSRAIGQAIGELILSVEEG